MIVKRLTAKSRSGRTVALALKDARPAMGQDDGRGTLGVVDQSSGSDCEAASTDAGISGDAAAGQLLGTWLAERRDRPLAALLFDHQQAKLRFPSASLQGPIEPHGLELAGDELLPFDGR